MLLLSTTEVHNISPFHLKSTVSNRALQRVTTSMWFPSQTQRLVTRAICLRLSVSTLEPSAYSILMAYRQHGQQHSSYSTRPRCYFGGQHHRAQGRAGKSAGAQQQGYWYCKPPPHPSAVKQLLIVHRQ
jgi:hypothetical protein